MLVDQKKYFSILNDLFIFIRWLFNMKNTTKEKMNDPLLRITRQDTR